MKTTTDVIIESIESWKRLDEVAPLSIASASASIIAAAVSILLNTTNKAQRACRSLKGRDHSLCVMKYRLDATKKVISLLQAGKSKCKDDEKCVSKINKKIEQLEKKLKMFNNQVRMFRVRKD